MNIQQMKDMADDEEKMHLDLEKAKKQTLTKMENLLTTGKICGDKWSNLLSKKTKEVIADFKSYFEGNGFSLVSTGESIIEAEYKQLKFTLSGINYEGEYMYLGNFNNVNIEFKVGTAPSEPDYRYFLNNLDVDNVHWIDFSNKSDYISAFSSVEQLSKLNKLIEKNQLHSEQGIESANHAKVSILVHGSDTLYSSFKELMDAYD